MESGLTSTKPSVERGILSLLFSVYSKKHFWGEKTRTATKKREHPKSKEEVQSGKGKKKATSARRRKRGPVRRGALPKKNCVQVPDFPSSSSSEEKVTAVHTIRRKGRTFFFWKRDDFLSSGEKHALSDF